VKRRAFITLLGGAAATWPLAARAQQAESMRRIGALIGIAKDAEGQARIGAFRESLHALGWVEGRNVQFDERWAAGDFQLMQRYAKELVALKPDVILVASNPALAAMQQETRSVPIIFAQVVDPVAAGFVSSVARPGGNVTGFSHIEYAALGKWIELLKQIAPHLTRVAVLGNPTDYIWPNFLRTIVQGRGPDCGMAALAREGLPTHCRVRALRRGRYGRVARFGTNVAVKLGRAASLTRRGGKNGA